MTTPTALEPEPARPLTSREGSGPGSDDGATPLPRVPRIPQAPDAPDHYDGARSRGEAHASSRCTSHGPDSAGLTLLRAAAKAMPAAPSPVNRPHAPGAGPASPARAASPASSRVQPDRESATLATMHASAAPPRTAPGETSLGGRLRTWYHQHPFQVDSLIALGVALLNIPLGILLLRRTAIPQELLPEVKDALPLALGACLVGSILLALRRRWPLATWLGMLALIPAFDVACRFVLPLPSLETSYAVGSIGLFALLGLPITLGTVAVFHRPLVTWMAWVATVLGITATTVLLEDEELTNIWRAVTIYSLIFLVTILVGLNIRASRRNLEELRLRSSRLALAREQSALLAAAEERSRIAREMHDVVAHSLAVMITMADGASAAIDRKPEQAKQALEMLAETGRSALADTRRLVGVLREDPTLSGASMHTDHTDSAANAAGAAGSAGAQQAARPTTSAVPEVRELPVPEFAPPGTVVPVEPSAPIADLRRQATGGEQSDPSTGGLPLAPAPEQSDIGALVERFKAAGVPVSYTWSGKSLPPDTALQLTVFRIAQEALTNVLRYAPTTKTVEVRAERHTGTVVLTVENEAAPGARPMHGSGKGLIGMRERAAVYGGTVQAGPTATGWRVSAVLRWDENDEGTSSWQMPL